jgi:L-lysine 6-transaminase
LRIIEREKLVQNARAQGARLLDELHGLARRYPIITAVRGRGLLTAFNLPDGQLRDRFWNGVYELGLLVLRCGERSIRLRPVLDLKDDALDEALKIIDAQCRRLA